MTPHQFDIYRNAFTHLLACSADAENQPTPTTCANGWIGNLGSLLDAEDRKRV